MKPKLRQFGGFDNSLRYSHAADGNSGEEAVVSRIKVNCRPTFIYLLLLVIVALHRCISLDKIYQASNAIWGRNVGYNEETRTTD